jgi:pyridoxamine 5'-phosphate oxidase
VEAADLLRGQPVMAGPLPEFDVADTPDSPGELFLEWLARAVQEKVTEPQVVNLSTADDRGRPSSRVVILRDVDAPRAGWLFASHSGSRKGGELAGNPWAAMLLYWTEQARQIRVRGRVEASAPEVSARDFLSRPEPARLASLTGRQSAPLAGTEEFETARAHARDVLESHPEAVPSDYTVYTLWADEVEFWQGEAERRHVRLRYQRGEDGWSKGMLWP